MPLSDQRSQDAKKALDDKMERGVGVVTPVAVSDAMSTTDSTGVLPLLPTLDDLDDYLNDPLPDLPDFDLALDNNASLSFQNNLPSPVNLPFPPGINLPLKPLPSLPCPPDKIDDKDVSTIELLRHYLIDHYFDGRKCSNCSVQVICQQSGQNHYCRMCYAWKCESDGGSVDLGLERDDNPSDAFEAFSNEEVGRARNLPQFKTFLKKPLRSPAKGSANAYRRKKALLASLEANDLSPPTYTTFTRYVHGLNGTLRWLHIPILVRIFSQPFGYHVGLPEIVSVMEQFVAKESQTGNRKFFFSASTFRNRMQKDGVKPAKRDQMARNMTYIIRATLMILDLIDISDSHFMVDVLINAFSADEVFPTLDDSAIVKYFAALHYSTSIVVEQCKLAFERTATTSKYCSSMNVADVYLTRAHSGTVVLDLLKSIALFGFVPELSDDPDILIARYPQLKSFLQSALNPSSLQSYLIAMAGNYNTFDPDEVYLAVMSGEGSCGGGVWVLPLFQVAYISHLVRTGFHSDYGGHPCLYSYNRRKKSSGLAHVISLRENNTNSSIRSTFGTFGPANDDGSYEVKGHVMMTTFNRPHHKIEAMGVQNFLNKTINVGVKQFDFNFDSSDEEKRCFEREVSMMMKKVSEDGENFKRENRLIDSVGRLHSLLVSASGEHSDESSRDIAYLIG
jgi:hypothetical protein